MGVTEPVAYALTAAKNAALQIGGNNIASGDLFTLKLVDADARTTRRVLPENRISIWKLGAISSALSVLTLVSRMKTKEGETATLVKSTPMPPTGRQEGGRFTL